MEYKKELKVNWKRHAGGGGEEEEAMKNTSLQGETEKKKALIELKQESA